MYSKKVIILLVIVFSSIATFSVLSIPISSKQNNSDLTTTVSSSTTTKSSFTTKSLEHNPINITSDFELATIATSGNGTVTNPYIIANLIIKNCNVNTTGIAIQNTDKYFILRNILVSGCLTGFMFQHVKFGSITNSLVTNYSGSAFFLNYSSNNTLRDNIAINGSSYSFSSYYTIVGVNLFESNNNRIFNNTVMNSTVGIVVSSYSNSNILLNNRIINTEAGLSIYYYSDYNILTNNIIMNSYYNGIGLSTYSDFNKLLSNSVTKIYINGFFIYNDSDGNLLINNTVNILQTNNKINLGTSRGFSLYVNASDNVLINNTATNSNTGFDLESGCNNTILKNNFAFANKDDYLSSSDCVNTTLTHNTFIIVNNKLVYFESPTLITITNSIFVFLLIGIYCGIVYGYYNSKKMKKAIERTKKIQANNELQELFSDRHQFLFLGITNAGLLTLIFIPGVFLITVNPIINSYYATSIDLTLFQLSPWSVILLLGGVIETFGSIILFQATKSFKRLKIAEMISLIGFITQLISFILTLQVLQSFQNSIIDPINNIKVNFSSYYIIKPELAYLFFAICILIGLITYLAQRSEYNTYFKKIT